MIGEYMYTYYRDGCARLLPEEVGREEPLVGRLDGRSPLPLSASLPLLTGRPTPSPAPTGLPGLEGRTGLPPRWLFGRLLGRLLGREEGLLPPLRGDCRLPLLRDNVLRYC